MRTPTLSLLVALALLLAACAQATISDEGTVGATATYPTEITAPAPSTTTTVATTTSTSTSTTTTTTLATGKTTVSADGAVLITEEIPFTSKLDMDVLTPTTPGDHPVVIMFHGGGWVGGHPDDITPLAMEIAAAGAVVFNAPYRLALRGGGYPMTFEDASCAVRFARRHAPQFGGDPGSVIVVGYSAGAHIGAVTALTGDSFNGDCAVQSGSALPDAFVGVAGPYDTDLLDPFMSVFYGTDRAEDAAPWEDGNPHNHVGDNPNLVIRLVHGKLDLLAPVGFSIALNDDLDQGGYDVELTIIEEGTHRSVVDPLAGGEKVVAAVFALSS